MHYDDILRTLGEFGLYQKRLFLVLCLMSVTIGIRMMITVFIQAVPDHRCAIPGYDNDTYKVQSPYHAKLINETIPVVWEDGRKGYDECHLYSRGNFTPDQDDNVENKTIVSCNEWVFDKSNFDNTAAMQMAMVCDDSLHASYAHMIFTGGNLVGVFVTGMLGDRFGRKKILFASFLLQLAGGVGLAWAPEFISYCVIRFLNGASAMGVFTTAFVIGLEMVGPSKRTWIGIVFQIFFAVGEVLLCGLAYVLRDWRYLEIVCSAPTALFLAFWWVIPESPRWLLNEFRNQEAEVIIRHAARVNKVTLAEKLFEDKVEEKTSEKKGNILKIFMSPVLFARSVIIFLNWCVISMAYYGLSLNTDNLGTGSLFINFTIAGLVEIPANVLCILLLDRVGRKILHCSNMILGGTACLLTILTILVADESHQWTTVMLAMIGKLGVSAAFAIIYIFTSELFPTVVRQSAMGASSAWARGGGMLAPYIVERGKMAGGNFGRAMPLAVFGACSVGAGLLALFLPETLNKDLPETMEDGESFGKKSAATESDSCEMYEEHRL